MRCVAALSQFNAYDFESAHGKHRRPEVVPFSPRSFSENESRASAKAAKAPRAPMTKSTPFPGRLQAMHVAQRDVRLIPRSRRNRGVEADVATGYKATHSR